MPHYADGTKAKIGDLVRCKAMNPNGPVTVGFVAAIMEGETCNALVDPAGVISEADGVRYVAKANGSLIYVTLKEAAKLLVVLALFGAALLPVQTFAQPPPLEEIVVLQPGSAIDVAGQHLVLAQLEAPAPSAAEKFLDMALTPEGIALILGTLATLAGLIWSGRELAFKRRFALGIYHAYQITNDLVDEGLVKPGGKPQKALQVIDEYMVRHGWRPLKSNEQAIAELGFKSLHGAEKQQVKVLAEAQLAAARGPIVYGGDK